MRVWVQPMMFSRYSRWMDSRCVRASLVPPQLLGVRRALGFRP